MRMLPADVETFMAAPVAVAVPCFACEGHGRTASANDELKVLHAIFSGQPFVEPQRTVTCGGCKGRGTWVIRPDGSLDDNGVTS
jgi:hypothetical protein